LKLLNTAEVAHTKIQSTNYYNHCTAQKSIPLLKKRGQVSSTEKTITGLTQVKVEQQQYQYNCRRDKKK
jgi:hypothetical protein|tara:strand:+ start:217 stop:423 length:207 start_codon:yes stop_codon:yes gene_type:complete